MGVKDWDPAHVNVPRKIDIEAEREKKNYDAYARAIYENLEYEEARKKEEGLSGLLQRVVKPTPRATDPNQEPTRSNDNIRRLLDAWSEKYYHG